MSTIPEIGKRKWIRSKGQEESSVELVKMMRIRRNRYARNTLRDV